MGVSKVGDPLNQQQLLFSARSPMSWVVTNFQKHTARRACPKRSIKTLASKVSRSLDRSSKRDRAYLAQEGRAFDGFLKPCENYIWWSSKRCQKNDLFLFPKWSFQFPCLWIVWWNTVPSGRHSKTVRYKAWFAVGVPGWFQTWDDCCYT